MALMLNPDTNVGTVQPYHSANASQSKQPVVVAVPTTVKTAQAAQIANAAAAAFTSDVFRGNPSGDFAQTAISQSATPSGQPSTAVADAVVSNLVRPVASSAASAAENAANFIRSATGESSSTGTGSGLGLSMIPASGTASAAVVPDYLYADLARAYGMDASTAYQEALANTSYQRAVKDLQAAGLNPALLAQGVQGSGGVYYPQVAGDGSITMSSGRSSAKGLGTAIQNGAQLIGTVIGLVASKGRPSAVYSFSRMGSNLGRNVGNILKSLIE